MSEETVLPVDESADADAEFIDDDEVEEELVADASLGEWCANVLCACAVFA